MLEEVVLLAEEVALLRSIADDLGSSSILDPVLWPLAGALITELLLVQQEDCFCLTEWGRQFLVAAAAVEDGEPVALDRMWTAPHPGNRAAAS